MNLKALIFREENVVDEGLQELRNENEALWGMVRKHYCADHEKWFSKTSALNMHMRWHKGNNPFKK